MGVAVTSLPGPRCHAHPPPTQAVSWAQGVVGSWLWERLGPYLVSDRRGQAVRSAPLPTRLAGANSRVRRAMGGWTRASGTWRSGQGRQGWEWAMPARGV